MTERQKKIRAEAKARIKAKQNEETQLEKLYMWEGKLTPRWKIRIDQMQDMSHKERKNERLKLIRLGFIVPKRRNGIDQREGQHKLDTAYWEDNSLPETKCGLFHNDELSVRIAWSQVSCRICLKARA
jgi:hypothetical protein